MKTENNSGKRIGQTKMRLKAALFSLLENKPLNRISIKELCARAGIHRSTFYLHYSDQYALMREIEEETLEDVLLSCKRYIETTNQDDYKWLLHWFLNYVEERRAEYRILLDVRKAPEYAGLIMERVSTEALLRFRNREDIPEKLLYYGNIYWCTGILSVVYEWLMEEDRVCCEQMADMLEEIIELSFK